jgi:uncharacterized membrane protein
MTAGPEEGGGMGRIVVIGFGAHQSSPAAAVLDGLRQECLATSEQPVLALRDRDGRLQFRQSSELGGPCRVPRGSWEGMVGAFAGLMLLGPIFYSSQMLGMGAEFARLWTEFGGGAEDTRNWDRG